MKNHFSFKRKIIEQTLNNFTIIKSITIILLSLCQIYINCFLCSHKYTNFFYSQAVSLCSLSLCCSLWLFFFLHFATSNKTSQILLNLCALQKNVVEKIQTSATSQVKLHFFLLILMLYSSLSPSEDPWSKGSKFFIADRKSVV